MPTLRCQTSRRQHQRIHLLTWVTMRLKLKLNKPRDLLVHNFVVSKGNSTTEAPSLSPSAFAKHTHTTIWLNTMSRYFEMPFPSQRSLQFRQINIYLVRKRQQINPLKRFLSFPNPLLFLSRLENWQKSQGARYTCFQRPFDELKSAFC